MCLCFIYILACLYLYIFLSSTLKLILSILTISYRYLGILGSIFQNHLQRAWTLISDPQLVREDRWPEINNYLQMCSNHLGNQGIDVEPMTFDKNHPTEPEPDYVFQGMNETDRKPAKGRRAKRDVETVRNFKKFLRRTNDL